MAEGSASGDVPYLLLCFHAQQAAEKSVKAVLLDKGVDFPPTHNLSVLFALLPAHVNPPQGAAAIAGLTVYAVAGRYPSEIDEATSEEHREAVELARTAVRWAEGSVATH